MLGDDQWAGKPRSNLVDVPVDLCQDWPTALQQAGFDVSAPSVRSAEGLLRFLPAAAQDLLFDRVQALTATGSRIAVEAPGPDFNNPDAFARRHEQMQQVRTIIAKLGEEREIPDVQELWYLEDRTDVSDWLRGRGWEVSAVPAEELMARYDRRPPADIEDVAPRSVFVSAQRSRS